MFKVKGAYSCYRWIESTISFAEVNPLALILAMFFWNLKIHIVPGFLNEELHPYTAQLEGILMISACSALRRLPPSWSVVLDSELLPCHLSAIWPWKPCKPKEKAQRGVTARKKIDRKDSRRGERNIYDYLLLHPVHQFSESICKKVLIWSLDVKVNHQGVLCISSH